VHRRSRRADQPFVAVNLAAVPEALTASELFGHEPGAFTGAAQRRFGRFEAANGATLFLDEIGELSFDVQVMLLRVLQEGEFERLGGSQTKRVDVRLVSATNQDLDRAVSERRFRADLFYRLCVFRIHLAPLRERRDDIPVLTEHLLRQSERTVDRRFAGIEPASMDRLMSYSWPGNIRELRNVLEQSAILCDEPLLHVPADLTAEKSAAATGTSMLGAAVERNEMDMIERALADARGRVAGASGAAARLGVPASTLESKIRRFNIDKLHYRATGLARARRLGNP
jgi:formate hydrogenlyase transcriptional activator